MFDVVVVGAGLTGTYAAWQLEKKGMSVQVLESMDRVGGRLFAKQISSTQSIDIGGGWIPGGTKIEKLVTEDLNLETFRSDIQKYPDVWKCPNFLQLISEFPEGVKYPFEAPKEWLNKYDNMTASYWVQHESGENEECKNDLLQFWFVGRADGPYRPDSVSMLNQIWYWRYLLIEVGGKDYYGIRGGLGQVPVLLAQKLKRPVRLSDPVTIISQTNGIATIATLKGKSYKANHVIVSTSAYISGRITYEPPLSWKRNQLNQNKPLGTVAKINIQYLNKFWLDNGGLSGKEGCDTTEYGQWSCVTPENPEEENMLTLCIDATDPNSENGLIVCLIEASQYDLFAARESLEERKEAVLQELATKWGDEALDPIHFEVGDWPANPSTQGCYNSAWPPNVLTRFGSAIIEPHGVIQWANTENTPYFPGETEGCIYAAEEVIKNITGVDIMK